MAEEELIEQLATCEHASWAKWMEYLFSKCDDWYEVDTNGQEIYSGKIIPLGLVERWEGQAKTHYVGLSEQEKQSDRDEVAHILPIIREYALSQCGSSGEMAAQAWGLANANHVCILDMQRQISLLHDEVFCTDLNRPGNSNKTLLGHVNNLYRLVYSLQEEDSKGDEKEG